MRHLGIIAKDIEAKNYLVSPFIPSPPKRLKEVDHLASTPMLKMIERRNGDGLNIDCCQTTPSQGEII
jgi:hypothetical protein